ncbi:ABC transporter substrate-binding protein SapA [Candidatus Arsenophonus nilaparvatae]|uniref:ABC transporter substrate-binding protein SapA n=1 Tax=Candidatus Arsenophonus nilaparvatae TaxID=1247023 RepID=UPI00068DA925|nr:ABC transporter substrate-binding protein SapA [Candidatus Arsenophonus nilaparvatae]
MRYLILWIILINVGTINALADTLPPQIRQNSFIYCVNGIVTTFNPQIASTGLIIDPLAAQLYDRLLEVNPFTYKLNSELASHWKSFDKGATYRFYLKRNIPFQTTDWFTPTRTLNADDVVFSFSRMFDKNHPYHYVGGGNYPYFDSLQLANNIRSIRKIDNYTVEFKLYTPDASFLWHLATRYAPILSQEYAQYLNKINHKEFIDWQPVGTGPFMLVGYQTGQFIKLNRHNNYWKGKPLMQQVVIDLGAGGTGRISKLLTGECDVLAYPAASQLKVLREDARLRLSMRAGMNIAYLIFNTSKPPLDQLKVRQAIAYSINNERLMQSIYYGTAETATSVLPRASWAYDNQIKVTDYNPEKAKEMLEELGLSGMKLDIWVPVISQSYNPSPLKTAELIQADLAKVGIKMNIHPVEGNLLENKLSDRNYDMILDGWSTDSNDPDSFFRPLLSCAAKESHTNLSKWCNPYFDELLREALVSQSISSRINYYHQAQSLLAKELPVLPLAYSLHLQAYRYDIKGLVISAFGNSSFAGVYRDGSIKTPLPADSYFNDEEGAAW